jgi:Pyruvate/2-oxoacid:ferredoxin oxidoreductase gamma subunit
LGNARAANSAMLGFWAAIVGAVSQAAMRQSLADSVPSKTLEVNLKVFDVGFDKGLELKKNA